MRPPRMFCRRDHGGRRATRKARLSLEQLEELTLPTGTPFIPTSHMLFNPAGTLSTPAPGNALDIAVSSLVAHADELGLTAADVQDPIVTSQYSDADTGISHIYLRQQVNGLEVAYADMNVSVLANGSVLSAGGSFVPGLAQRVSTPGEESAITITAAEAIKAA